MQVHVHWWWCGTSPPNFLSSPDRRFLSALPVTAAMPPRALLPTGPSARPLHRLFTTSLPRHAEPEGKLTTMGVRAELLKAKRENMVRDFKNWVENQGEQFKWPAPEGYNYLGAYDAKTGYAHRKEAREGEEGNSQRVPLVFPENKNFKVDPVLSDDFKDKIYEMVMQKNFSVRAVSMLHGVSLERVAAVVRLKQIERDMLAEVGQFSGLGALGVREGGGEGGEN